MAPRLLALAALFVQVLSITALQTSALSPKSNTLPVFHASASFSSSSSPSSWDKFLSQDQSRLSYLTSLATAHRSFVPIASGSKLLQSPTYIVRANIGTPPQHLMLAIDTSNDAAWIPTSSCIGCPQSFPLFNSNLSTTFEPVPCGSPQCTQVPNPSCPPPSTTCGFSFTYGSSNVSASLAQDTLSLLPSDVVSSYTFGAITQATGSSLPPQGLLGLGRGPLSFLSQTASLYSSTFSYCLPSFRSLNFSGTLRLGPSGQPVRIKTTPLLTNPRRSSLYYVNLLRIRVGRRFLDNIPPSALAFNPTTGAGTILDSGTMFTRLVAPAYNAVRDEFRRRVNKNVTTLGGFDTCYNGPVVAPAVTFEFSGMNFTLAAENVMIHSSSGDISCLAMAAAPDNVNSVLNVIASMQQQNHRVLFDVPGARVGLARELCTTAA